MTEARAGTTGTADLGDVRPAVSRHRGRRSSVEIVGGRVVVGTADGRLRGLEANTLDPLWETHGEGVPVTLASAPGETVLVGRRGERGKVSLVEAPTGERRWSYPTADDVGESAESTRFRLPFVADAVATPDALHAVSRRYDGATRSFESAVYAFGYDGSLLWRLLTDASPVSIDTDGNSRVAVAYNRRPEDADHDDGAVVYEADSGDRLWSWDPEGDGERRVGDVSLHEGALYAAGHADYRGYRVDGGETVDSFELARRTEVGDETLYAYPNHVEATRDSVYFVTGSTYRAGGRDADGLHPDEHSVFSVEDDEALRVASHGGFAPEVDTADDTLAVPTGQNLRTCEPDVHGLSFVTRSGAMKIETPGIVTSVSSSGSVTVFVEEPVSYREDDTRGSYRLHTAPNKLS